MPEICCSRAGSPHRQASPTPTCRIAASADRYGQAQEPTAGCISSMEEEKALKGPFTVYYKLHCSSGPDSLNTAEQRD